MGIFQDIQIAQPCEQAWEQMAGTDRVRFCQTCKKNVYNVSSLSAEEAEALIVEREGKLCLRVFMRSDGTIITSDCPSATQAGPAEQDQRIVLKMGQATTARQADTKQTDSEPDSNQ